MNSKLKLDYSKIKQHNKFELKPTLLMTQNDLYFIFFYKKS
jgi:hypothetical protein